jgi:uncharacterized membrane protein
VLFSPAREQRLAWIFLGAAMAVAVAFLFWLQRDLAFADDSINWIMLNGFGSSKVVIEPYGGHLILTPMLIFRAVLEAEGASYTAMGVVQVALLLILSGLIFEYGRRRLGPLLALPPAIVILFLGSSSNVLMQPMIGIQFLCALAPGVAGLLALERSDRRGDIAACVFFTLATLGFEMGLAFVIGGAVSIALRDDRRRRAWIVGVPFVIYGIWRIWAAKYGGSGVHLSNIPWIPAYAVDSLGVVVASFFGLFFWVGSGQLTSLKLVGFDLAHLSEGLFLLAAEAFAAVLVVRRLLKRGPLPNTFWVALAVLVAIWVEQGLALAPNRTPGEVRYVFPDTVVFLLLALECARGIRATRLALGGAVVLTAVAVLGNLPRFQEGRTILVEYSTGFRSAVAVMELDGPRMRPDFNPATEAAEAFTPGRETLIGPTSVAQLNGKYGRFGYSIPVLREQPEGQRETADIVATRGLGLEATPSRASGTECRSGNAGGMIRLPPGGAVLRGVKASSLLLRRFGSHYVVEVGRLPAGQSIAIRIPQDSSAVAWHAFAPDAGRLTACRL